tara:strand:- start:1769 stop:2221 length:453 start_codon:yes stop_codon:yes gene_type:complete
MTTTNEILKQYTQNEKEEIIGQLDLVHSWIKANLNKNQFSKLIEILFCIHENLPFDSSLSIGQSVKEVDAALNQIIPGMGSFWFNELIEDKGGDFSGICPLNGPLDKSWNCKLRTDTVYKIITETNDYYDIYGDDFLNNLSDKIWDKYYC